MTQHSENVLSLCLRYSKNSSISDAIQNKSLPQSEEFERILVKDFYLNIIISAKDHISLKISPKDFLRSRNPQKTSV